MAEFDVKQVSTPQWLGIGAGLLALIDSFLPWYSISIEQGSLSRSESGGAWDVGFIAWFSILLLIAAAVIAALPLLGKTVPSGNIIWLGLAGLAFVLILVRWLTYESSADLPPGVEDVPGFSAGASFGTILGLILAAVSAVGAFLAYRSASSSSANRAA